MSVIDGLDAVRCGKGLTRRGFLVAVGSVSLLAACRAKAPPTTPTAALPAKPDASFLLLSQALTGKRDLDPATAARIETAFATLQPELHAQFPALNALVGQGSDAQAMLAAAGDAKPAALAIITAWYTGTVGKGIHAVTVSYRDALMQRPVDDGLSPATYAHGGPAWWTAAPPAPVRAHA